MPHQRKQPLPPSVLSGQQQKEEKDTRAKWKKLKAKEIGEDGILKLSWKVSDASARLDGVAAEKVSEWVSSIMCWVMSA